MLGIYKEMALKVCNQNLECMSKEHSVVDGMLLLWLRCFHSYLTCKSQNSDLIRMVYISHNFLYLSSLHFPWCCDYYIKFPFKRKWFVDNSGPSLWAFIRKNLKEYIGRLFNSVLPLCFTVKTFLLKHPSWWYESHATFHLYSSGEADVWTGFS